jgi:hypothetical protein
MVPSRRKTSPKLGISVYGSASADAAKGCDRIHAPSVNKLALPPAAVVFTVNVRSVAKRAR